MNILTVQLGPLRFWTLRESVSEQLGDDLEIVGNILRPGDRGPRPLQLVLPVRGPDGDPLALEKGQRLRRQVRALMENAAAKGQGFYFAWSIDPELDGWLLISTAVLDQDPAGAGSTFGEWKLTLKANRIGTTRSHREARRLDAYDRRLPTTPLDELGRVFGTNFAAQAASARLATPLGRDVQINGQPRPSGTPLGSPTFGHRYGDTGEVAAGDVVSFDTDPAVDAGQVTVRDRPAPASPEADWVAVLGSAQALTPGDAPVLSNGLCRVRWVPDRGAIAVDDAAGAEIHRVSLQAGGQLFNAAQNPGPLLGVTVVEATTERALLNIRLQLGVVRVDLFVALQRGWTGPRVEAYATDTVAKAPAVVKFRVVRAAADAVTVTRSGAASDGAWTGRAPWALIKPAAGSAIVAAVSREADTLTRAATDTAAYGGAARPGPEITGPADGWLGVSLSLAASTADATLAGLYGAWALMAARQTRELVSR